jgi:hypothetical protein
MYILFVTEDSDVIVNNTLRHHDIFLVANSIKKALAFLEILFYRFVLYKLYFERNF